MPHAHLLLSVLVLGGCVRADVSPGASAADVMPLQPEQPQPPAGFALGPALQPAPALLSWLESSRRRLRLPVVIPAGWADHGGDAFIGLGHHTAPDAIHLRLSDTAMGIPLATHLREACPDPSRACAVWLDGDWGATVPLPGEDGLVFSVRQLHRPVTADDPAHVLVAAD